MTEQTATQGSVGSGQQFPEDSNSDFDVIAFIVSQMLAELETMMPVQVTAVHVGSGSPPASGTVDVQLLVSLLDGSGNAVQQGIIYGLPYFRLQGGQWAVVIDPDVKDFGYIIGASRDISNVIKTPGIANPASYRKYSFSDGIYMGGCLNAVPAATLWLKSDGTFALKDKPGNTVAGTSDGLSLNGVTIDRSGNIATTGTISGQGVTDTTNNVTLNSLTVTGVQTGSGTSGPPTPGS